MGLDTAWAVAFLHAAALSMAEHRDELIALDRAIGDSDHGENMDRGFEAVVAKLGDTPPESPAAALKLTAMVLMSKVGGAAGPLYGTAFLRAATALGETADVGPDVLVSALQAALDGVVARGKAEAGDKTMVDAWIPAVAAARDAATAGEPAAAVLAAAASAAAAGAAATEPMLARKGRASYLGERSVGHRDPGAQSSALLLLAAAQAASQQDSHAGSPESRR